MRKEDKSPRLNPEWALAYQTSQAGASFSGPAFCATLHWYPYVHRSTNYVRSDEQSSHASLHRRAQFWILPAQIGRPLWHLFFIRFRV